MSRIQAIETEYKGYHFRSRLEARWAVFFDTLGIDWKYEHEGYETTVIDEMDRDGEIVKSHKEMYLPDFVLTGYGGYNYMKGGKTGDIYVEVKGDPKGLVKDFNRQVQLHDWGGVLPKFADSYNTYPVNGLLLLGEIPEASQSKTYFHPIVQHYKGLTRSWAMFTPKHLDVIGSSNLSSLLALGVDHGMDIEPNLWHIETRQVHTHKYYPQVYDAYAAARSARFEHGQSGAKPLFGRAR